MNITLVNEENFESEVLKSDKPVLVDFYASWCGPCQIMSPIVESIADEMKDKVKVVKIDTDECMELALQYRIQSIPTFKVFKKGEEKHTFIGVTDKNELVNVLR